MKCKITQENLQELYDKLCIKPNTTDIDDKWCQDCLLGRIEYNGGNNTHPVMRSLCFAIWHDGALNKDILHNFFWD